MSSSGRSLAHVVVAALGLLLALAGCPHQGTRKTLVPEVPQGGDAAARRRFQEARAAFLRDGSEAAAFQQLADEYPDDPIKPWAELYAGIAAVRAHTFPAATKALGHVLDSDAPPALARRAALFLGIAKNYQGEGAAALPLLARGAPAVEGDEERTEYLAAVAYATAAGPTPLRALAHFDELWPKLTAVERAVAIARIELVVGNAAVDAIGHAWDGLADHKGPSAAVVGVRLAALREEAGDASGAATLRAQVAPVRAALGLPPAADVVPGAAAGGPGRPGLVGAIVPLGGKQQRVAEAAVAGVGLAAGGGDGKGVAAIEVRAATSGDTAAAAVDDLAHGDVVAIVGPIDGASVDAASARAAELGLPLLSLSPRAEERAAGRTVYHLMHSAEARARALAKRAIDAGVTRLAVLAPDSGYGKAVSAAFVAEVGARGGTIVVSVTYPPETKSFAAIAKKLDGSWQGVFVPEQAERLGLITPALAAAGYLPRPVGTKKAIGGRPVLLLSTAEALGASYMIDAGRHSLGALLAPGYYPEDHDPASRAFVERFTAAYGRPPGAVEAYAYDGAQLAAAGQGGRAALLAALAKGELEGLTGALRFDDKHRRADVGVIYTVVEEAGAFVVRIAR